MNRVINIRSRLFRDGQFSCHAGRALVRAEKTSSHDPAQTCDIGPAIEAVQAFAVVGCRSFSRHDAVFTGTLGAIHQEALSRRPWRPHWVR